MNLSVRPFDLEFVLGQVSMQDRELRRFALELADDDHDATEDTRARIAEARKYLAHAAESVALAVEQFPPTDEKVIAEARSYGLDVEPGRCDVDALRLDLATLRAMDDATRFSAVARLNAGEPVHEWSVATDA